MEKPNKKVPKTAEHEMRNKTVHWMDGIPPPCLGIWHQPKRPINQKKK